MGGKLLVRVFVDNSTKTVEHSKETSKAHLLFKMLLRCLSVAVSHLMACKDVTINQC